VLVFVDADVRLFPDAVAGGRRGARRARARPGLPVARPVARGAPSGSCSRWSPWLWATTLPRAAGRALAPAVAGGRQRAVPGADRAGYDRAGGHAAVRGEVLEDIALLRAVKRAGGAAADRRLAAGGLPDVRRLAGAARGLREVAVGRGRRLPRRRPPRRPR
jgi:hypothetical protein